MRTVLGLEGEKVAERVAHFGNKSFSVTNFMTHFLSVLLSTVFSCVPLVVVMAWASPASIFGFGGAQEGPFSAALENGFQEVSC